MQRNTRCIQAGITTTTSNEYQQLLLLLYTDSLKQTNHEIYGKQIDLALTECHLSDKNKILLDLKTAKLLKPIGGNKFKLLYRVSKKRIISTGDKEKDTATEKNTENKSKSGVTGSKPSLLLNPVTGNDSGVTGSKPSLEIIENKKPSLCQSETVDSKPSHQSETVDSKPSLGVNSLNQLTKKEKKVLTLRIQNGLSNKQIARALDITIRSVEIHLQNLKKKGLLDGSGVYKGGSGGVWVGSGLPAEAPNQGLQARNLRLNCYPPKGSENIDPIRLHGIQVKIELPVEIHPNYKEKIGLTTHIEGNALSCYSNAMYLSITKCFFGDNKNSLQENIDLSICQAQEYINHIITDIEHEFKVKTRNVRIVKSHFAAMHNGIARYLDSKKHKLQVRATEDDKVWLLIDNSIGSPELETIHNKTGLRDMETVTGIHFNDLRDNNPRILSEVDNESKDNKNEIAELKKEIEELKTIKPEHRQFNYTDMQELHEMDSYRNEVTP